MKKFNNFLSLIILVLVLIISSCGVKKKYEKTKAFNSITAYEKFLERYPDSKYSRIARDELKVLYEDRAWKNANYYNTISRYKIFISEYPKSKYISRAEKKIQAIEEEQAWNHSRLINSTFAYDNFLKSYPKSKFAYEARNRIKNLKEEKDWYNTEKVGSIGAYKNHIKKYPYGKYSTKAKKKIIDLEVDEIFEGDHGTLPPMNQVSTRYNYATTNKLEIFNDTKYILTVRYSGPESKKAVIYPRKKSTITLKNGSYRITASVNAASVQNYAGTEKLEGGEYSEKFYIKTISY